MIPDKTHLSRKKLKIDEGQRNNEGQRNTFWTNLNCIYLPFARLNRFVTEYEICPLALPISILGRDIQDPVNSLISMAPKRVPMHVTPRLLSSQSFHIHA